MTDTTTAPTAELAAVLDAAGEEVPDLLGAVERRLARATAEHGEALARHAGDTIAAGGKRLRPLLVLLAAGSHATRPGAADALVRAAVAVELVHSATLVHDDVLDGAALRRGRPTVVASAGRSLAIATGDLLFSRAFAELAAGGRAGDVSILSRATSALARGELLQRADAFDARITVERYMRRCELKTASLFDAACRLGGEIAGEPVDELGAFGARVGLAFQLLDDVLDVSGPPERTGKPRGADLLDGTVTLPLILARERDPDLARIDLRALEGDEQEIGSICGRIEATGALAGARARALEIVDDAKRALPALAGGQRRALELVADGVADRYA